MKITCPSCDTAYKLADGALGATGRKVRCTRCGTVWHASPAFEEDEPPPLERAAATFPEPSVDEWKAALADDPAETAEAAPDPAPAGGTVIPFRPREVESIEAPLGADPEPAEAPPATIDATPAGFEPEKRPRRPAKPAPKTKAKPKASRFSLPASPLPIVAMAAGLVVTVVLGALAAREQVVRLIPDLAGLYASVGLTVNLRGLDFAEVTTVRELDGSTPVLVVEGAVVNVESGERPVPTLRFALKSAAGREVYAWTMDPPKDRLEAGDSLRFKSRLPAPPEAASVVEVRFTDRRGP